MSQAWGLTLWKCVRLEVVLNSGNCSSHGKEVGLLLKVLVSKFAYNIISNHWLGVLFDFLLIYEMFLSLKIPCWLLSILANYAKKSIRCICKLLHSIALTDVFFFHFSLLHRVMRFRGANRSKGDLNAASWFTRPGKRLMPVMALYCKLQPFLYKMWPDMTEKMRWMYTITVLN